MLAEKKARAKAGLNIEPFLLKKSGQLFYNTSPLDMKTLMGDQDNIGENLRRYMDAFSPSVRDIFERFEFHTQIDRLAKAGLLYLVTEKFATIDLHPRAVSNAQMGTIFEELIRKFAELLNETAGEHFTPREVIRLMVNLIFMEDDEALSKRGVVRHIYDPTAGTGGMLSVAGEHLAALNPGARLVMYGQEAAAPIGGNRRRAQDRHRAHRDDDRRHVEMTTSGPSPRSSLVLYETADGRTRVECRFEEETIWLTQGADGRAVPDVYPQHQSALEGDLPGG